MWPINGGLLSDPNHLHFLILFPDKQGFKTPRLIHYHSIALITLSRQIALRWIEFYTLDRKGKLGSSLFFPGREIGNSCDHSPEPECHR